MFPECVLATATVIIPAARVNAVKGEPERFALAEIGPL